MARLSFCKALRALGANQELQVSASVTSTEQPQQGLLFWQIDQQDEVPDGVITASGD